MSFSSYWQRSVGDWQDWSAWSIVPYNPRIPLGGKVYIAIEYLPSNYSYVNVTLTWNHPYIIGGEPLGGLYTHYTPHDENYKYDYLTLILGHYTINPPYSADVILTVNELGRVFYCNAVFVLPPRGGRAEMDFRNVASGNGIYFLFVLPHTEIENLPAEPRFFMKVGETFGSATQPYPSRRAKVYLPATPSYATGQKDYGLVIGLVLDLTGKTNLQGEYKVMIVKEQSNYQLAEVGSLPSWLEVRDSFYMAPTASTPLQGVTTITDSIGFSQTSDTNLESISNALVIMEGSEVSTTSSVAPTFSLLGWDGWVLISTPQAILTPTIFATTETTINTTSSVPLSRALDISSTFSLMQSSQVQCQGNVIGTDIISSFVEENVSASKDATLGIQLSNSLISAETSVPLGVTIEDTSALYLQTYTGDILGESKIEHTSQIEGEDIASAEWNVDIEDETSYSSSGETWSVFEKLYVEESSPLVASESIIAPFDIDIADVSDFWWAGKGIEAYMQQQNLLVEEETSLSQQSDFLFLFPITQITQMTPLGGDVSFLTAHALRVGELMYSWGKESTPLIYSQQIEDETTLAQSGGQVTYTLSTPITEIYITADEDVVSVGETLTVEDTAVSIVGERISATITNQVLEGMPPHADTVHLFLWKPPTTETDESGVIGI